MAPVWLLVLALGPTACATTSALHRPSPAVQVHTFTRDYTNAHVVRMGEHMLMVDSGLEANAPALDQDMRRAGLDPARLDAIVLSHGHADHAGGAGWFQSTYGTPVIVGAGDEDLLATGRNDTLCPTDAIAKRRLADDQAATYRPYRPDVIVEGRLDLQTTYGIEAAVVLLPGHTDGSLVVVMDDAALVGDLFRGSIVGSSAKTHFYNCDLADNRRDIAVLLDEIAPKAELFFTGHFGPPPRTELPLD